MTARAAVVPPEPHRVVAVGGNALLRRGERCIVSAVSNDARAAEPRAASAA